MKKVLLTIIVLAALSTVANATVHVKGHYRSNGTYVGSHTRSNPDGIKWNNKGW